MRVLIVQKYLFRDFVKTLIGSLILFVGLFIISKLMEQLSAFIRLSDTTPFNWYVMFFVYEIPFTMIYLFPVGCLFAGVYTLARFNQQNELTAIYNSGMSISYAVLPVVILVFVLCLIMFIWDKEILYDNHTKHRLLDRQIRRLNDPTLIEREDITFFGKNNKIYIIKKYAPALNQMQNAQILFMDNEYNFSKVISAHTLTFDVLNDCWSGTNVFVRTWTGAGTKPTVTLHKDFSADLDERPFFFERDRDRVEHLSAHETLQIAKKRVVIGGKSASYFTEYYLKTSMPFMPVILILLAIPLSTFSRKSALVLSFTFVLITAFLYYIVMYIGTSLGSAEVLPPFIAGWFGNIIFLIFALYLQKKLAL